MQAKIVALRATGLAQALAFACGVRIIMEIFAIITSLIVCTFLGLAIGFSQIAGLDVKKGLKPVTKNRFVLVISKPREEYNGLKIIWFLLLILLWLIIFFGSLMACGILLSKYAPGFLENVYFLFPFFFIGLFIGVKAWKVIPKIET